MLRTAVSRFARPGTNVQRVRSFATIRRAVVGDDTLEPAVKAFTEAVTAHRDHPTSCTVYKDGDKILELYAGQDARKRDFGPSHVSTTQSVSKVVLGLAAAMLEDRGLLSLDDPVVKHWPDFEMEKVKVKELLNHTSGLSSLVDQKPYAFYYDPHWKPLANYLATRSHFDPETHGKIKYHCHTGGLFLSQIISRVDPAGRCLRDFCREEIFEPLELNMQYGMDSGEFDTQRDGLFCMPPNFIKTADFLKARLPPQMQASLFKGPPLHGLAPKTEEFKETFDIFGESRDADWGFRNFQSYKNEWKYGAFGPAVLRNENGSGNLITNTGSLAKLGAVLASGGGSLLSEGALRSATRVSVEGRDPVFDVDCAFTDCGWSPITKFSEDATLQAASADEGGLVGWWGLGGALFLFSPEKNLSFAFQSSYMAFNTHYNIPAYSVLREVLQAVE